MELVLIKKPYCEACTIMVNIVKNCLEQVNANISLKVVNLSSLEDVAHKVFPTLIFKKDNDDDDEGRPSNEFEHKEEEEEEEEKDEDDKSDKSDKSDDNKRKQSDNDD